jgi:hypothetical protein
MADRHSAATEHVPAFITAPGQTDVLMVVMAVILLLSVLGFGILFLRLHSLPERMAHRTHKIQFEIVAVLCLIALFTHIHAFWIAALLLAMIDLPDFGTSLSRIAGSAEKIAGIPPGEGASAISETVAESGGNSAPEAHAGAATPQRGDGAGALAPPDGVPARTKGLTHA